ncbi:hypothetical protein [Candidatus Sororendozoicomonas aggregata]|uniref:hypothetical protein n=1 Tax=Candidatus Sororendozoicomonas aggregata TaxID=3073239 RepID=UPI002ED47EF1
MPLEQARSITHNQNTSDKKLIQYTEYSVSDAMHYLSILFDRTNDKKIKDALDLLDDIERVLWSINK